MAGYRLQQWCYRGIYPVRHCLWGPLPALKWGLSGTRELPTKARVNCSSLAVWGDRLGATCLGFCGFRDLVLPDGNRVSAFSVASTAIAAAQWSSTQVRWRIFFFQVVWWCPKSQKGAFLWCLRSSPRAILGSASWLLSLMSTDLTCVSSFDIL